MKTKKIFVLGNGFDLAHYLPTAYIHFMEAMQVIESSSADTKLGFDDLFKSRLDNKDEFFLRTKELYKTDDLILSVENVNDLREKLKNNGWFQHFKYHLSDVDTWIDFESEIETVLQLLAKLFSIEFNHHATSLTYRGDLDRHESLKELIKYLDDRVALINTEFFEEKIGYNFDKVIQVFNCFRFFQTYFVKIEKNGNWDKNYRVMSANLYEEEKKWISLNGNNSTNVKKFSEIIYTIYLSKFSDKYVGFNEQAIFRNLSKSLSDFTLVFQWYISNIIEKLEPKNSFHLFGDLKENTEAVFTFNYSNSFQRFYNMPLLGVNKVRHLHGSAEQKNIVLGVSDLNDNLKKYKIYEFVKTHQKIINNTDYQFLDENYIDVKKLKYETINQNQRYEIIIWGHSLDISDAEYIKEIFELNSENLMYRNTVIKVWYHETPHSSLANLMNIMGKDIIQEWVKKGWLKFEKIPNIYELNGFAKKETKE